MPSFWRLFIYCSTLEKEKRYRVISISHNDGSHLYVKGHSYTYNSICYLLEEGINCFFYVAYQSKIK